jgi:2-polyprenyl-3-methyl-5-hydroxy-6-metoxy-1,4-benzoquinol methylase
MTFVPHKIQWTHEKAGRLWAYYSQNPAYDNQYFGALCGRYVVARADKLIGLKNLRRLLDFSCGRGDVIGHCLKHMAAGSEVHGVDVSAESVEVVNRKFHGQPGFAGATVLRDYPLPFDDGSFDLVLATEVVEHVDDEVLEKMLKECRRLVSDRGFILITTPNEEDYAANEVLCPDCGCIFHRWQHLRTWNTRLLAETVERSGFRTVYCKGHAWGHFVRELLGRLGLIKKWGILYIGKPN